MNEVLLTKHLHELYNKEEVPWVQLAPHALIAKWFFWLKDTMKLCDQFRGFATTTVGSGDTIMLWEDVWKPLPHS
jgi:hypothetical protein